MIFWLTIMIGILAVLIGKKKGFFPMWAILFNIMIPIYISVMLTPTVVGVIPDIGTNGYNQAGCVAGIAILFFVFLQFIATNYFTADSDVILPDFVEKIGTSVISFIAGYLACCFIFFIICIMPFSDKPIAKKILGKDQRSLSAVASVAKTCDFVGAISLQCHEDTTVPKIVDWFIEPAYKPTDEPTGDPNENEVLDSYEET